MESVKLFGFRDGTVFILKISKPIWKKFCGDLMKRQNAATKQFSGGFGISADGKKCK